jgi:zinc D-Ala-D-Ala carboxypeptidase
MATLNQAQATTILRRLGWRIRTTGEFRQAVTHFQDAWSLGGALTVDGKVGPKTSTALRISESRRQKRLPTMSAHFSFVEFACKCGGRYTGCARIWVRRSTVREAEQYRKALGRGVSIVSGCRCWAHNKAVGGATRSQHMAGKAVDFPPAQSVAWFQRQGLFKPGGLGANPHGLVRHGDTGPNRGWSYST